MKKENHNPQTAKFSTAGIEAMVQEHLQRLNENLGMIRHQEPRLCREYQTEIAELCKIFAMRQNERLLHRGAESTFSQDVVRETERCISECLAGLLQETRDTTGILSLLEDYRVVGALQEGKCCVSLSRLHSILQDNYEDSWLCGLFNMILGCHSLTEPRVISF